MQSLYEDLMWRGLIKDTSTPDLKNLLDNEKITFYWGTDPSADSLHLGHYSSLVTAKRLALYGHHPILLMGGSTGLIGDPRPTAEREIISYEKVLENTKGIQKQVNEIFKGNVQIVNNYDWTKDVTFLGFLRDIGKYINVHYMLNKDIIARRLETGITYAEFSYTLLQGYDFLHLFEHENCVLQAAGSDQWGNITTGIELIKKKTGKEAYGFTMPLILDANGKKFGKSEGNALWLDKNKTSSYQLYQYLINTDDSKVLEYLKVFTFLTPEEIEEIIKQHEEKPELRIAQKTLAKCIITDLHGKKEYEKALKISEALFTDKINTLTKEDILNNLNTVPQVELETGNIVDALVNAKVFSSKREARELISGNALSLNNQKITDLEYVLSKENAIDGELYLIRKGKKNYYIGKLK